MAREQQPVVAAVMRNREISEQLMRHAHLLTPDRGEQIMALLTAASVMVERQVGPDLAADMMAHLLAPTLADWLSNHSGAVQ